MVGSSIIYIESRLVIYLEDGLEMSPDSKWCKWLWFLVQLGRDLTNRPGPPKGSVWEGKSPAISGKSRLVKYYWLVLSDEQMSKK